MTVIIKNATIFLLLSIVLIKKCESSSSPGSFPVDLQSFAGALNQLNLTENESLPISLSCLGQLAFFVNGLQQREIWAISIFDAWSKLQSGIFSGNLANYGHFDQCVRSRHSMDGIGEFQGQHCVTSFQVQSNGLENFDNVNDKIYLKKSWVNHKKLVSKFNLQVSLIRNYNWLIEKFISNPKDLI